MPYFKVIATDTTVRQYVFEVKADTAEEAKELAERGTSLDIVLAGYEDRIDFVDGSDDTDGSLEYEVEEVPNA